MYRFPVPFLLVRPVSAAANSAEDVLSLPLQNQDTVSLDTVCRLYEVGRQKLAEEGDDDDQVGPERRAGSLKLKRPIKPGVGC